MGRFWGETLGKCVDLPENPVVKLSHHSADLFGLAHIISNPQIKTLSRHKELLIHPTRFFAARNLPQLEPAILAELAPENKHWDLNRAEKIIHQRYFMPQETEFKTYCDFCNCVYGAEMFFSSWLETANPIFALDSKIPKETSYFALISGNLQLGAKINFTNYLRYRHNQKNILKFLPFAITERHLRFFILPFPEEIKRGRIMFHAALNNFHPLLPLLPDILLKIDALVKMGKIKQAFIDRGLNEEGQRLDNPIGEIEKRIGEDLAPFTKKFGFVYQGMKGSKDTLPFSGFHYALVNGPKFQGYETYFG